MFKIGDQVIHKLNRGTDEILEVFFIDCINMALKVVESKVLKIGKVYPGEVIEDYRLYQPSRRGHHLTNIFKD